MATSLVPATSPPGIGDFRWTGDCSAVDLDPELGQPEAGVQPPRARQPSGSEA